MRFPRDILIDKLATRVRLDDGDIAALKDIPCSLRDVPAHSYLLREGAQPVRCGFIVSGFAFRQKISASGGRQIVGILIPGDFTDLQQLFLDTADHSIQALTQLAIADMSAEHLRRVALERPNISQALWIDVLVEGSITRENMLNIGRRDGPTRLAHLLCEFETRLKAGGLATAGFELPMTQEQIGDTLGLTAVHVNRTLKQLGKEGLIKRNKRSVQIADWPGLQWRADFNPTYLHLDQGGH